nr:Zinc finger PHD finger [Hymenolepis microstoma]
MAGGLSNEVSYESILARTANYNRQIITDKQNRLPFLDNATGIAQRPCQLQRKDEERYLSPLNDKVFTYCAHRWKKTKKNTLSHSSVVRSVDQFNNNARAAQDALWRELDDEDSRSTWATNPVYDVDSEGSEQADETYGGRRKRRKTRGPRSSKQNVSQISTPASGRRRAATNSYYSSYTNGNSIYEEDSNEKYPSAQFVCEVCGGRYKTKTGLNYHYNSQHSGITSQPKKALQVGTPKAVSNNGQSLPHTSVNTGLLSALIENTSDRTPVTYNSNTRNIPSTILEIGKPRPPEALAEDGEPLVCDYCGHDERLNPKKPGGEGPEPLLCCSDCTRRAHFSCLQFVPNMITSVHGYRWQCIECKTCWLCGTSENDEEMLFCDDCDRGYHMFCLRPPLTQPPEGSWSCALCLERFKEAAASNVNASANSNAAAKPPAS